MKAIEYTNALIEAGIDKKHAKAIAETITDARLDQSDFVSKLEFKSGLKELENTLIKWMIGTTIAVLFIVFAVFQIYSETTNQKIETYMTTTDQKIETYMTTIDQKIEAYTEATDQKLESLENIVQQNHALTQKLVNHHLVNGSK